MVLKVLPHQLAKYPTTLQSPLDRLSLIYSLSNRFRSSIVDRRAISSAIPSLNQTSRRQAGLMEKRKRTEGALQAGLIGYRPLKENIPPRSSAQKLFMSEDEIAKGETAAS